MVFYGIVVTVVVTLSMKGFTNNVILTYFWFIQMPIIATNFGILCILANTWENIVMDDMKLDDKPLRKWQAFATL